TKPVIRSIAKTPRVADAALRLLFQGVTPDERKAGLTSSFAGLTDSASNPVEPLSSYYQGVTISNGVATVKFTNAALTYLNNTACIQATVKAPIEQTLLQFPTVQRIQYAIDGQIFDQWDA
ncbi:MAG TPA: GerMN domain-containing protein, partial [Polyangiaceae bacterium]|nr:GerMN domain-containing protein [Polyangiaceae bacterium]